MKSVISASAVVLLALSHVAWAVPVSVQVLGLDKKPVAGAQVRARFWKTSDLMAGPEAKVEPEKAQTDARGIARFEAPDANQMGRVRGLDMVGAATAWSETGALTSLTLKSGENTVTLSPVGTARGLVVDADGKPIGGALVRLEGATAAGTDTRFSYYGSLAASSLSDDIFTARTNAQGRWSIARVPLGGSIGVSLDDPKWAIASAAAPVFDNAAEWAWDLARVRPALELANASARSPRAARSEDGVLVARPASTITGRVLDPTGAPIEGALIAARSAKSDRYGGGGKTGTSDAKGEWKIEKMIGGDYLVSASLPPKIAGARAWVAGEPSKVSVAPGASAQSGDIKLIEGGTVAINFVDSTGGKGIKGGQAYAQSAETQADYSFAVSETSDESGKGLIRLKPGKYKLILFGTPEDYLAPEKSTYNDPTTVEVAAGQTQSVTWKLSKGLVAQGRLVDEAGKPIPNASVSFRPSKNEWNGNSNSTSSDAKGNWRSGSFGPGAWKVSVSGNGEVPEWKIVKPEEITVPSAKPIDIVLAPIAKTSISGRALDDKGAPLPGAKITAKISVVENNYGTETQRTAYAATDGSWRLEGVPQSARTISIEASRTGYSIQKTPQATQDKDSKAWAIADAVFTPRASHLSGLILDAQKKPVANAQVLVAQTQSSARSDAEGRWSIDELPEGDSEVVAVGAAGAVVSTVRAPKDSLSLALKPQIVGGARDVDSARAILEDAWETSRGSQFYRRDTLPASLAFVDPDSALLLARGREKKASDQALIAIIRALLGDDEGRTPEQLESAQAWAQANLASIEDAQQREQVFLMMADALASTRPEDALKWLAQARTGYEAFKDDYQRRSAATKLAALSARLKQPDANDWFDKALKLTTQKTEGMMDFGTLAWEAGGISAEWAQKVVEAAIAATPNQPQYSNGPESTVGWAAQRLAQNDLPAAKRLMEKHSNLKSRNGGWEMDQARAQLLGARSKAGEDVNALLKDAAELSWQPQVRALALIAESAPANRRVELLKKALDKSLEQPYGAGEPLRIIKRLLPLDREAARAGLDKARERLVDGPRDDRGDSNRVRGTEVALWAWLYRSFDPAQSRLVLEREWALGASLPQTEQDEWNRWQQMSLLAQSMMFIDTERAQQLALRLPIAGYNGTAFIAQRAIARFLLASDEERQSRTFEFWGRDEGDDNRRYNFEW